MGFRDIVYKVMQRMGDLSWGSRGELGIIPLWFHPNSVSITLTTLTAEEVAHRIGLKNGDNDVVVPDGSPGQCFTVWNATGGATATVDATTQTGWASVATGTITDSLVTLAYIDDTVGWIILGLNGNADTPNITI